MYVRIKLGVDYVVLNGCTIGCLTGSRVGGAAARVPILHVCSERGAMWMQDGFQTPAGVITVSIVVDNIFAAGKSCAGVTRILDDVERFLSSQWNLQIKPASRCILAPANSPDTSVTDDHKWPVVTQMKVLGAWIQSDGGIDTCFAQALKSIWGAFLPTVQELTVLRYLSARGLVCCIAVSHLFCAFGGHGGLSSITGPSIWMLFSARCIR